MSLCVGRRMRCYDLWMDLEERAKFEGLLGDGLLGRFMRVEERGQYRWEMTHG